MNYGWRKNCFKTSIQNDVSGSEYFMYLRPAGLIERETKRNRHKPWLEVLDAVSLALVHDGVLHEERGPQCKGTSHKRHTCEATRRQQKALAANTQWHDSLLENDIKMCKIVTIRITYLLYVMQFKGCLSDKAMFLVRMIDRLNAVFPLLYDGWCGPLRCFSMPPHPNYAETVTS